METRGAGATSSTFQARDAGSAYGGSMGIGRDRARSKPGCQALAVRRQATVIVTDNMLGHLENVPGDGHTLACSTLTTAQEVGTFMIPN